MSQLPTYAEHSSPGPLLLATLNSPLHSQLHSTLQSIFYSTLHSTFLLALEKMKHRRRLQSYAQSTKRSLHYSKLASGSNRELRLCSSREGLRNHPASPHLGTARYSQCVRSDRRERERQSAHGGLQGAGRRATARRRGYKAVGRV